MKRTQAAPHGFQFHYDQLNLEKICSDRDLQTPEIHPSNDYYGQASIIKRYISSPEAKPLKVVLEHGINLDDLVWECDANAPLPMIASCSQWRSEIHKAKTNKQSIPIGFGSLYAKELVKESFGEVPANERRGTIAFPCHSTHTIKANFAEKQYAEFLNSLPAEYQPVFVCVYWKDILENRHLVYIDHDLPVISCGHMFDKDFLLRFQDLCLQFKFATANKIGTHLFQAASAGCEFFFSDISKVTFDIPENEKQNCGQTNSLFLENERKAKLLFPNPIPSSHENQSCVTPLAKSGQKAFVDQFVGTSFRKSKLELRDILKQADWKDKVSFQRFANHRQQTISVPPYVWRTCQKPINTVLKLRSSIDKRMGFGKKKVRA